MKTGSMLFIIFSATLCFLLGCTPATTLPSSIDLTGPVPQVIRGHLGMGTSTAPGGRTIDADSQCLYRDGQPWMPVMGEFHFSRYPRAEWRDELLKMKAGGITIVATYVFWIHHEEQQGQFDWTGRRSLRDFLLLCKELDLYAVVRMGPWCHGEVRNGGFPDWVQNADFWADQKSFKRRTNRPEFMQLVAPLYQQIAEQIRGLLWKDGGPVIGIQLDNECGDLKYLTALKQLARDNGIDVPFYTMTGWNRAAIPQEGLLPLFGAYADGFWCNNKLTFRKSFFFSPIRDDGDMGALDGRIGNVRPERNTQIERFPYVCCEIGGGMPSSYDNRIYVTPQDTAAIALVRLGNGNNMPGYYMYHGGINPQGRLTTLNETKATGYPNDMPIKDYDFGAPIGTCGQIRLSYHLLRQQHLFLSDFGTILSPMRAVFQKMQPQNFDDTTTVRWTARSNGQAGFIFFNNHQRYVPLADKQEVQFAVNTRQGILNVPYHPITLPADSFGIWPFNMDFGGIHVVYATAQPLCKLETKGQRWFFFTAIEGITPEFAIKESNGKENIKNIKSGTGIALSRRAADGIPVNFVVLTPQQGRRLWKIPFAGQEHIILSDSAILPDSNDQIRIESLGNSAVEVAVFPPCDLTLDNNKKLRRSSDGIFRQFTVRRELSTAVPVVYEMKKPAANEPDNAMQDAAWKNAAVWQLQVPNPKGLLRIHYSGDAARIYAAGQLIIDHFYNGQPLDTALWRLNEEQLKSLEIHIMPLRSDSKAKMAADIRPDFSQTAFYAEISKAEILNRTQWTLRSGDTQ